MSNFILIDGDLATFEPTFGPATVVVRPGTLTASGPTKLAGKQLCVDGDEASVSVAGCSYVTSTHPVAGVGTLAIQSLGGDQVATKTKSGRVLVMLVGSTFTAKLTVQTPAQTSTPSPTPDPTPQYIGSGTFVTANRKFKGT